MNAFVHVQVAGLVGRAETLSAFFFLLSLLHYRKAILNSERGEVNI